MNNPLMYDRQSAGGIAYPQTERYRYDSYFTTSGLTDGSQYQTVRFNVHQQNVLLHWTNAYMDIHGRLIQKDNGVYPTGSAIALIHNALPHLFSNIKLTVGSVVVENINHVGHVSSLIFNILFPYSKAKTSGVQFMFVPDTDKSCDTEKNKGFKIRQYYLIEMPDTSRGSFKLRIPLYMLWGFFENFYALKGYPIELELVRGPDYPALIRDDEAAEGKLTFSKFILNIPIVDPCNALLLESLKGINDPKPFLFSFRQRHGLSAPVPPNQYDYQLNISTDSFHERPQMIWVGFQRNPSATPTDQKFNHALYSHEDVETAYIKMNNIQYPSRLVKADFAGNDNGFFFEMQEHMRANYLQFPARFTEGNMLNPVNFKDLFTIYCFDVSKGDFSVSSTTVVTSLHVHFKVLTKANLKVYCSWYSDRTLEMHSDGKPLTIKSNDSYR